VAALLAPAALQAQGGGVVCKDGSNGSTAAACASHGGMDSVSTAAAQKARGGVETGQIDTTKGAGMAKDTTLKAKPGVQTGPSADTGAMARDTSMHHSKSKKHHRGTRTGADSAAMRPDSAH
jgi:hypothetical protein